MILHVDSNNYEIYVKFAPISRPRNCITMQIKVYCRFYSVFDEALLQFALHVLVSY